MTDGTGGQGTAGDVAHEGASAQTQQDASMAAEEPASVAEAIGAMPSGMQRQIRLAKLAGAHAFVWLLAMAIFAAADSWHMLSDLALAGFLAAVSGVLAGLTTSNLVHEWGHYIGARRSGGEFEVPDKLGLFVYDWNFRKNSVEQFLTMSYAGTIGGILSLVLIWIFLPLDTLARAAVFAGAVAGVAFGARVEWPVLKRVRAGGEPLAELSRIDLSVLRSSFVIATVAGLVTLLLIAP